MLQPATASTPPASIDIAPPRSAGAMPPYTAGRVYPRVALLVSYLRSQAAAALATAVDFATVLGLVELARVHYVAATAFGALLGGVTAFATNRHWSFLAGHAEWRGQAARYALVWFGSLCLNCLLVYLLTDGLAVQYAASKLVTALVVGAAFNFPLHRYYVFR